MASDDELHLVTGGRSFSGWKSVRVRRSMLHASGAFELAVSWRQQAMAGERPILAGEPCEVLLGNDPVISGHVDAVDMAMDHQSHEVTVTGRDKTADLIDCAAIAKSGQWASTKVEALAATLAAPFGVQVRTEADTGKKLQSFALQEGETAFEAIDRACRLRGLLVVSDGAGNLVVTRAAAAQRVATALVLGTNLLALRVRNDVRDRFSTYTLKGQAPGSDFFNGAAAAGVRAVARDPGVARYRPAVLTADAPDVAATLQQRAQWEANVRAARGLELDATVQGWRHGQGLWVPNSLVRVVATDAALDAELLVTGVEYSLDERGTVARLSLTRADAYTLLPMKDVAGGAGNYWKLPPAPAKASP